MQPWCDCLPLREQSWCACPPLRACLPQAPWPPAPPGLFARISASRPGQPIAAFCGGLGAAHSMLSPPPVQLALLGFLTTAAALPLRATCREARAAVAGHEWRDSDTEIKGNVGPTLMPPSAPAQLPGAWRACFPRARCARLWWKSASDAALAHLGGLHTLDVRNCSGLTGAGFAHLHGLHTLDMGDCIRITDAAFVHLRGIHTLAMSGCYGITDAAFAHLRGIHTLHMSGCCNITDAALLHLRGIHRLTMVDADPEVVDPAEFSFYYSGINGPGLAHLIGIRDLCIKNNAALQAAAEALGLSLTLNQRPGGGGA